MKVSIEVQADPEWYERHEDPEFGLANETEWMKRAEIRVVSESGIDTSEIQWLEWAVPDTKRRIGRSKPRKQRSRRSSTRAGNRRHERRVPARR